MAYQCQTPDCALHLSGAAFPTPMPCPVCQAALVEVPVAEEPPASRSDFEQRVLDRYPYVIALPYRNMLDEQDGRGRLDLLAYILQNALKYMGLLVVGEYHASDLRLPKLNELFKHNLYQPSFGNWNQFLREGIAALEKEGHSWVLPEVKEGYAAVETAKRCKKYPVETAYTDEDGQMAYRTIQGTAIGTLINFRNRHLGHGTPLNKAKAEELYGQFKPVLDDLLEGLAFSELLTMVRAERNELYRLTGCSPEPILGRATEKEDQSKVWVEHEDGRRLEIMPFFILPGLVAGADPDSGVLVYEQFTGGKRIVFHGPDNSHGESAGEVLERLKSMIRLKEEEAPIPTSEMEEPLFHARLATWNDGVMAGLHREKKVIPDVYQPREDAETVLRGWTTAHAPLMVIAADAGSGKTNLLAEMTRQYGEFGLPVVLLRALHLESSNFKSALAAVLNLEEDWKSEALSVLDRPAEQPWMILVDGVNEHDHPEALFDSMLDFLEEAPRQGVKLILTWRVSSPEDLPKVDDHHRDLVYMAEQREGDHALARHALRLSALNREEIKAAWDRYAGHASKLYRPQFSFEDLVSADRALTEQFANPLLLRMFMELVNQRGLKHKPKGMADIWALWWRDQQTREREVQFLEAFAPLVMDSGESKVPLDVLFDHDALSPEVRNIQVDSAYQQLLRRGVLTQSFAHGEIEVGFTMEAAMFFVLGELAGRQSWTSADIASRLQESPRWEGPLQSMLRAQVGRGQLDLLCDCIDDLGVPDEFSSIALAQAFLLKPADQVLNALLENPSKSDWAVMEQSLELLKRDLNVRTLQALGQPLVDRGSSLLPGSAKSLIAITEFVEPASLTKLGAEASDLLSQQWAGSEMVNLSRLVQKAMSPVDALNVIEKVDHSLTFAEQSDLLGFYEVMSAVYSGCGMHAQRLALLEEQLSLRSNQDDLDEIRVAETIENLGTVLREQGEYSGAISRYEECLVIRRKALGVTHVKVAATIANIGTVLRRQGDYVGALSRLRECLDIEKRALGKSHPKVATTVAMMGVVLRQQGDYSGAISRLEECLVIEKKALGEVHPDVATTIGLIGSVLREKGDYAGAVSRYGECLEMRKRVFGKVHPKVAMSLAMMGIVLRKQGDYVGALSCLEECLAIEKKTLGESHPEVAATIAAVGDVLREKGDHAGAISRYEECLFIEKKALGEAHPEVAETIGLIGIVLRDQGDFNGAVNRLKECLKIQKEALGENHPEKVNTENHIWFSIALWEASEVNRTSLASHKKQVEKMSWTGVENMKWRIRLVDVLLAGSVEGVHQAVKTFNLLEAEASAQNYDKNRVNELKFVGKALQKMKKQKHD